MARSAWLWALRRRVRLAYMADSELPHQQSRRKLVAKRLLLSMLFRRVDALLSAGECWLIYMLVRMRMLLLTRKMTSVGIGVAAAAWFHACA